MTVTIEHKGPVTLIGIDRPAVRNAVDSRTAHALAQAFRDFERHENARVAVLHGHGGNFCAGADLKAIAAGDGNQVSDTGEGPMGPTRMRLRKPAIAAIEGYAVAGGLELTLWCDLRVMAEGATLGVFCRRFGVPLIDGGTVRLPRLIGMSRALDLILTGRPVDAAEALQMGLVNRVVPDGFALAGAEELARQIAAFPQGCLLNDRHSAYDQWDLSFEQAMSNEFHRGLAVIQSGETRQGAQRFTGGEGRHGLFNETDEESS
ncbi:MAG: crotonase/enoyl-CoA hydratase family protein [Acidobacteriota bacterium]|nr:crotonase/enoyl-CoA hydratase family protein [Acidobacteriota bacterium]